MLICGPFFGGAGGMRSQISTFAYRDQSVLPEQNCFAISDDSVGVKQEKMLVNRNCVRWVREVRGKTILPQIGSIRPVC